MLKREIENEIQLFVEIQKLEKEYKYYRNLYQRIRLQCCTDNDKKGRIRYMRDSSKTKLKQLNDLFTPNP